MTLASRLASHACYEPRPQGHELSLPRLAWPRLTLLRLRLGLRLGPETLAFARPPLPDLTRSSP